MVYNGYCLHHNLLFSSVSDYVSHKLVCEKLCVPYICTLMRNGRMCGKRHTNGSCLFFHALKVHHLYVCSDCEYVSRNFVGLVTHEHIGSPGSRLSMNIVFIVLAFSYLFNFNLGPYKCSRCVRAFLRLGNLKNHMHFHTRQRIGWNMVRSHWMDTRSVVSRNRVRHYTCYICPFKTYLRFRDLKRHFAEHTLTSEELASFEYLQRLREIAYLKHSG